MIAAPDGSGAFCAILWDSAKTTIPQKLVRDGFCKMRPLAKSGKVPRRRP
jgi:hypothetical protein